MDVEKKPKKRRKAIVNSEVHSIRFDPEQFELVRQIAHLHSHAHGKYISCHELIRRAVKMVYEDNEWLRECFRRIRIARTSKWFTKAKKR